MLYQSPADFCAEYAKAHKRDKDDGSDGVSTLDGVTVVSETTDAARVEALWYTSGHAPDAGFYDAFERIAFLLIKRDDGWRLRSEEHRGYE